MSNAFSSYFRVALIITELVTGCRQILLAPQGNLPTRYDALEAQ